MIQPETRSAKRNSNHERQGAMTQSMKKPKSKAIVIEGKAASQLAAINGKAFWMCPRRRQGKQVVVIEVDE